MKTRSTILATAILAIFAVNVSAQNEASINSIKGVTVNIEKNANGAAIKWQTAAESNTSQFEVEISYDNKTFESIRTVAASDITKFTTNYEASFKRTFLSEAKVYYRIKTVFNDGASAFTEASVLEVTTANGTSYASIH